MYVCDLKNESLGLCAFGAELGNQAYLRVRIACAASALAKTWQKLFDRTTLIVATHGQRVRWCVAYWLRRTLIPASRKALHKIYIMASCSCWSSMYRVKRVMDWNSLRGARRTLMVASHVPERSILPPLPAVLLSTPCVQERRPFGSTHISQPVPQQHLLVILQKHTCEQLAGLSACLCSCEPQPSVE